MLVGKRCIFEALIGIGKDPYLIGYKPSLHPEGARAPFLWLVRFNLSRAKLTVRRQEPGQGWNIFEGTLGVY